MFGIKCSEDLLSQHRGAFFKEIERRGLHVERLIDLRQCLPRDWKQLVQDLMDLTDTADAE